VSERRAAGLLRVHRSSVRYRSVRRDQGPLLMRLRELAAARVRFGYRRLTVLLRREGWRVNAKRVYRLYCEEGLTVRTKTRSKAALRQRRPLATARMPNERWSMDFVHERLVDGRWVRILTVVDQFTRECVLLAAAGRFRGESVGEALEAALRVRGKPVSITVDNGAEFASRALDAWVYRHGILAGGLQPGPAPQRTGRPRPGGVCRRLVVASPARYARGRGDDHGNHPVTGGSHLSLQGLARPQKTAISATPRPNTLVSSGTKLGSGSHGQELTLSLDLLSGRRSHRRSLA